MSHTPAHRPLGAGRRDRRVCSMLPNRCLTKLGNQGFSRNVLGDKIGFKGLSVLRYKEDRQVWEVWWFGEHRVNWPLNYVIQGDSCGPRRRYLTLSRNSLALECYIQVATMGGLSDRSKKTFARKLYNSKMAMFYLGDIG